MKRILLALAVVAACSLGGVAVASAHDGHGHRHGHGGRGGHGGHYDHGHYHGRPAYYAPPRAYYSARPIVYPVYPARPVYGYGYGYPRAYPPVYGPQNYIGISGPRISVGFGF